MSSHTKHHSKQKSGSTFKKLLSGLVSRADDAGWKKTLLVSSLLAIMLGIFLHWQYLKPMDSGRDLLREENSALSKQIAIARLVQETRPAFIEEYRKAKEVYSTLRELLPNSTELSKVMAAAQELAKQNNARITLFDASTPGVKSALQPGTPMTPPPTPQQPPVAPAGQQLPGTGQQQQAPPPITTVLNERVIPAQVVGNYPAIMRFLRDIAGYELIIDTRDITITSLNKQASVNLKIVAFDAPPTSSLPPDPPELR